MPSLIKVTEAYAAVLVQLAAPLISPLPGTTVSALESEVDFVIQTVRPATWVMFVRVIIRPPPEVLIKTCPVVAFGEMLEEVTWVTGRNLPTYSLLSASTRPLLLPI